ncbi:MAG: type II toxin-antitoxin system HicB family antitoxin [candidate division KSB1 bacterium]|nr:type II toxin-antitoxin system HicB family antitoxin [candidate division KSB1 bacterium]MDZ7275900.1 type II toxin-antitoxin system HicB family antitoxin [candidate division KSB1 bacterium]MDZ7287650.1 type II toxin-antitoxin system HicB family antitoxin [candidate division KSB1 bacterium]MDZ7306812.1 type II toxin-antitoxin system HicB family antitoxin [candidate division KSB1 bacterium]MDZ7350628.1 type II toxin-antitoxin system HicB family antitoxin [candidate division KSB1 bacterium]
MTFPDLAGCIAEGRTSEKAMKNGMDAAKSWLATAREFGDGIPQTRVLAARQIRGACSQAPAHPPARARRAGRV